METVKSPTSGKLVPTKIDASKHGVSPVTGEPLKGPAKTAIVKVTADPGKGQQVPLSDAIKKIQPNNTVTYHGTQVQITEGNQGTDQVKGLKHFMTKVDNGATRADALSDTRAKYPNFKLAPYKGPAGKGSSAGRSADNRTQSR